MKISSVIDVFFIKTLAKLSLPMDSSVNIVVRPMDSSYIDWCKTKNYSVAIVHHRILRIRRKFGPKTKYIVSLRLPNLFKKFVSLRFVRFVTEKSTIRLTLKFEEENLKVDRQIILADIVTIVNNRLYCKTSDGSEINKLACVRAIFNAAKALKINFSSKQIRVYYHDILKSTNNTTYNLVLNSTYLELIENGMGYAICSNINKNKTRVELHNILQSKFFSHLSIISRKLLNSFLHKNVKIQKTFLLAMDKKALGIGPLQTLTTMCDTISQLTLLDCSGFGSTINPNSEFDTFFTESQNKTDKVDYYFSAVINKATRICKDKDTNGINILFRVYKNLLSVHFSLDEVLSSFLENRKITRYPFHSNLTPVIQHKIWDLVCMKLRGLNYLI